MADVTEEVTLAKQNELKNLLAEHVYEEVHNIGQSYISVRWVVTSKKVDGLLKTKARLVARGFEEDSSQFRTDSPTCMRESIRIMLSLAASFGWEISSMDIKAAFLQGKLIDREVYLKPPKEAGVSNKLWKLRKVVYGLSDASRIWYLRVIEELKKLNVSVSKYDKALFHLKKGKSLIGIMMVHVDDFLWAGSREFAELVIDPLKKVLKVSKPLKPFSKDL